MTYVRNYRVILTLDKIYYVLNYDFTMCIYSVHSEFPNMATESRNMYTEKVHPELSPVVKKKSQHLCCPRMYF